MLLFVLLTVVLPLGTLDWEISSKNSAAGLAYVLVFLSASRLSWLYYRGLVLPMMAVFHIFLYLFMGLAPLAQYATLSWPQPFYVSYGAFRSACLIVIVGTVAWELAYRFSFSAPKKEVSFRSDSSIEVGRFWILLSSSLLLAAGYAASLGSSLFESREAVTTQFNQSVSESTSFSSIAVALGTVPLLIAALCALELRKIGVLGGGIVVILLSANAIVSNPVGNPRFWVGTVALSILLVLGQRPNYGRRSRLILVVLIFGFIVLFPLASLFRYSSTETVQLPNLSEQLTAADFDSFQQLVAGVEFVHDNGVLLGQQLLGTILFWIPRTAWPSKPQGTGGLLGEYIGSRNTNLSAPLWVEGYIDFGIFGVLSFLAILGWISARLDRLMSKRVPDSSVPQQTSSVWPVLIPFIAFYQIIILRGSLIVTMPRLIVALTCVLVVSETIKLDTLPGIKKQVKPTSESQKTRE